MDLYPTAETWTGTPGAIAPADGNAASSVAPAGGNGTNRFDTSVVGAQHAAPLLGTTDLGPNNERLEDVSRNWCIRYANWFGSIAKKAWSRVGTRFGAFA